LKLLGGREQVLERLIMLAYFLAHGLDRDLPRSRQDFEARVEAGRSGVVATAYKAQDLLYRIFDSWFAIRSRLQQKAFQTPQALPLQQDVAQQLERLLGTDFLLRTPWVQLQQYPRYLQAVLARLDKYPLQVARDQEATRLLTRLWQQYQERLTWSERHEQQDEKLDDYRWLLEELRVSLFAQTLGTRVPVSERRLQKAWQELLEQ